MKNIESSEKNHLIFPKIEKCSVFYEFFNKNQLYIENLYLHFLSYGLLFVPGMYRQQNGNCGQLRKIEPKIPVA